MFNFSSLSYFQMGFNMPLLVTYICERQNIAFDTPLLFSGLDLSMSTFVPLDEVSYWPEQNFPLFTQYNMYINLEIFDSYGPDLLKVSGPPWNFDSHGPQGQLYQHAL